MYTSINGNFGAVNIYSTSHSETTDVPGVRGVFCAFVELVVVVVVVVV